ncbi:hypothetical protein KFL_000190040 [Klebsormidium nitens]|uniref:BTB domain-containing protein n=1 Tax=Klebsormidium nitens TaxID=105231 RepID=A0A1Y1HJR0_KLENI|nr:hypothetical protein KFL_000190040 [Klebsormidium nitens]|eukprot:GAQ78785.1 hypothetical protein KFL_000190040 [Klebsormidium nitens]
MAPASCLGVKHRQVCTPAGSPRSSRLRSHEDSTTSSEGEDESEDTNDSEYEEKSEDTDEEVTTDAAGHGGEKKDKKDKEDKGESGRCPDARLKFVRHLSTAPVTITFTIRVERTFLERDWNVYRRFKAPEPKSALLRDAENDGDVYLLTKDGTKVAAQSAVLMKVPYFSALLEPHWKRKPQTPGQQLELDLPCPVEKTALQIFLNYVYGDTGPLFRILPLHAQVLQDILRLADACDVPALCSEIDGFVEVTKENAQLWLQWLREMRGSNIELSSIRKQMVGHLKQVFSEAVMWEDLDDDQLAALVAFGHDLRNRES